MRPSLLVLDDEESICRVLTVFFEKKGYDVTTAGTSASALQLSKQKTFALGIFDLNLAGESGFELLSYFKLEFPDLPIIIYTGMGDEDTLEMAMLRGASGFLHKTAPLENLFEMVKSYVGKP